MGRPKKKKESIDWFTARLAQALSKALEKIEEEYDEKYANFARAAFFHDEFIHNCSKGAFRHWLMAYQWLVKLEWNSKHQIPEKKSVRDALKPQGLLLQKYFRMAERCLTFKNDLEISLNEKEKPLQYQSAVEWIQIIVSELLYAAIQDAVTSRLREPDHLGRNVKNSLVAIERERLALIKTTYGSLLALGQQNEFEIEIDKLPYQEFSDMIALKELLGCSMLLATICDQFHDDYWKPFLKQYSAWIAKMNSSEWQTVFLKSDNKGNLTEWQGGYDNSQICIGDLAPLKKDFFIRYTQQGFSDFAHSFFEEINSAYNPRKISFIAPKYF